MIDLQSAIKQLQELAEEHHERANKLSKLSCIPFCDADCAVEAGLAAAYDNAIEILTNEILTEKKMKLIDVDNLKTTLYERFHEEDAANITMVPLGEVIKFCDELLSIVDVAKEREQNDDSM